MLRHLQIHFLKCTQTYIHLYKSSHIDGYISTFYTTPKSLLVEIQLFTYIIDNIINNFHLQLNTIVSFFRRRILSVLANMP